MVKNVVTHWRAVRLGLPIVLTEKVGAARTLTRITHHSALDGWCQLALGQLEAQRTCIRPGTEPAVLRDREAAVRRDGKRCARRQLCAETLINNNLTFQAHCEHVSCRFAVTQKDSRAHWHAARI
eukprot:6606759-Prymnesium_polylepis.3